MRKTAVALALVLIAALGVIVPSVAAASGPTQPKVVIIVGATHSATAGNRADADKAYAEAIKYTSNVIRVYSPNATWTKVKAAVKDASIVIYMGHGNGWPSPYTYDAKYTTKDGFGLNATAGAGDSNNKYYGEPYVSTLDFAPGAIVLLHHLCYASGNSEPGNAEPTTSVARQRADNYAAGFLKAGAAAVLADGHTGAVSYLRALFTTHQSVESMWRTQSNANGHFITFASARTPGATAFQDPNTPTTGFYRSLVERSRSLTTDDVVYGAVTDTSGDPTTLRVPGNASVATDGAELFSAPDTTAEPTTTLPAGTRLHVVDQPTGTTAEGAPLVEVEGLDDPSLSGFMAAGDLIARDSTPPVIRAVDLGAGVFSPDGDGVSDTAAMTGRFTESVDWTVRVRNGDGDVLFQDTGTGTTFSTTWDGLVGGHAVADGAYTIGVSAIDAWQNGPTTTSRTLSVDTVPSQLTALSPDPATVQWFSPNGDGNRETVGLSATNSDPGTLTVRALDGDGTLLKKWVVPNGTGPTALSWDGRTVSGAVVPDGTYRIRVSPADMAGNTGSAQERTVDVISALRSVTISKPVFYPQDLDTLAKTTTLSFTLARPMTVTWVLRDGNGAIVDTHLADAALPAGKTSWAFTGRRTDGTMLLAGHYTSWVTATDGTLSALQGVAFEADAFRLRPSDTTPARNQTMSMRVDSAETLTGVPRLYIYQPGVAVWSVAMKKSSGLTYTATFKLKGGHTGTVKFKVQARDSKGKSQHTTRGYLIH